MKLHYRLLDHPFYKAWTCGEINAEQLGKYHKSYSEFIEMMPIFWEKALKGLNCENPKGKEVINDEKSHIPLWQLWSCELPEFSEFPKMTGIINSFESMSASELLGAIHAFEIQQPEVAKTKKQGLIEHYGVDAEKLTYFDEHMNEAEHIRFAMEIADKYADKQEFERGFSIGSELIYNGLDMFMN